MISPEWFQSPCAGNMFGKAWGLARMSTAFLRWAQFQSPCAGNMFGKVEAMRLFYKLEAQLGGFNPRVRGTCLVSTYGRAITWLDLVPVFQSPCAGNMFGKRRGHPLPRVHDLCPGGGPRVSIPVCGEHVLKVLLLIMPLMHR